MTLSCVLGGGLVLLCAHSGTLHPFSNAAIQKTAFGPFLWCVIYLFGWYPVSSEVFHVKEKLKVTLTYGTKVSNASFLILFFPLRYLVFKLHLT